MAKTPYNINATLVINRTNGQVIEREISITEIIQSAALDHLAAEFGLTPTQVNALVVDWRLRDLKVDVPHGGT